MKKKVLIVLLLVTLMILTSCKPSQSQILEEISISNTAESQIEIVEQTSQPENETAYVDEDKQENDITIVNQPSQTIHIMETLKGSKVTLNIDLDVTDYVGAEFGVYDTDLVDIDFDAWIELFFPGIAKEDLMHLYGDENTFTPDQRSELGIDEDYRNNMFAFWYDNNKMANEKGASYHGISKINFVYTNHEFISEPDVKPLGHLVRQKDDFVTPDPEKLKNAEQLTYELFNSAFKGEFTSNFVKSFSGIRSVLDVMSQLEGNENEFYDIYAVSYDRYIEGLPILFDDSARESGYHDYRRPDTLEAFIFEDEIFWAWGCIRDLILSEKTSVISANDALDILKVNYEAAGIQGEFDINRFELMYFPDYTDDVAKLTIPKGGGGAYAKYIPVWVIASGDRISENGSKPAKEYALIIDARDGRIVRKLQK